MKSEMPYLLFITALSCVALTGQVRSKATRIHPPSNAPVKRVRQELQTQYNRFANGFQHQNLQAITVLLAPGFTYNDGQKLVRHPWAEQELKRQMHVWKSISKVTIQMGRANIQPNKAVVWIMEKIQGIEGFVKGYKNPAFIGRSMLALADRRDTWIRTSQGWKLKTAEGIVEIRFSR